VFDEWTTIAQTGEQCKPGVWFFGVKSQGDQVVLTSNWICSPLHIIAVTSNDQDNDFGRVLRFVNANNRWRSWAMPMELLASNGDVLRAELLVMIPVPALYYWALRPSGCSAIPRRRSQASPILSR
jgi:putative DNA primase/helicase